MATRPPQPSGPFRWAGTWNNTTKYTYNTLVLSAAVPSEAYVYGIQTPLTGGTDPSIAGVGNPWWQLPPTEGDGVGSIVVGSPNLTGGGTGATVNIGLNTAVSLSTLTTTAGLVIGPDATLTLNGALGVANQTLVSDASGEVSWGIPTIRCGLATIPPGSTEYWISLGLNDFGFTDTAPLSVTLQIPDGSSQNWIVNADPTIVGGIAYIHVEFAASVVDDATLVSWAVNKLSAIATNATATPPTPP